MYSGSGRLRSGSHHSLGHGGRALAVTEDGLHPVARHVAHQLHGFGCLGRRIARDVHPQGAATAHQIHRALLARQLGKIGLTALVVDQACSGSLLDVPADNLARRVEHHVSEVAGVYRRRLAVEILRLDPVRFDAGAGTSEGSEAESGQQGFQEFHHGSRFF